jgi:hypothetical protein
MKCLPLAAVVLGGLAFTFAGCSSNDSSTLGVAIHPAQLYTGYDDGTADYKVPATLVNVDDNSRVKWTLADQSLGDVTTEPVPDGEKNTARYTHHVIVLAKKSGKTKLRATADGNTYEVPITITQYPVGARDLGNDLYQVDRTGGVVGDPASTKSLGCIMCHGAQGTARHDPSRIGGYDDAAILKTIATAVKPDGTTANGGEHKFNLDNTEQTAILARLRSLEPVDYPE